MVALEGGAVSYERGTPVLQNKRFRGNRTFALGGEVVSYERGTPAFQRKRFKGGPIFEKATIRSPVLGTQSDDTHGRTSRIPCTSKQTVSTIT